MVTQDRRLAPYDLVLSSETCLYQSPEYDTLRERLHGLEARARKTPGTGVFEILFFRDGAYVGEMTIYPTSWWLFLDFEPKGREPIPEDYYEKMGLA